MKALVARLLTGLIISAGLTLAGPAIASAAPFIFSPGTIPDGTLGQPYSQQISVIGGTPPYTFLLTGGMMPPGLGLAPSGLISGVPTQAGTFGFGVSAVDSLSATDTTTYSLTIGTGSGPSAHTFQLLQTGLPDSVPHQATVDGSLVGLPFIEQVQDGTAITFSFPRVVDDGTSVRYVTAAPLQTIVVSADFSYTASYTAQFLLTTGTNISGPYGGSAVTPGAWYDAGSVVQVSATAIVPAGQGGRFRFDHWSGDASGSATSISLVMSEPRNAFATYVVQYLLTITQTGLPAGTQWEVTVNGSTQVNGFSDWLDAGTSLSISVPLIVVSGDGTIYMFTGFAPPPPDNLDAPRSMNARYKTVSQVLQEGAATGQFVGPGADGILNSLLQKSNAIQADIGACRWMAARGTIRATINSIEAQAGNKIGYSFAAELLGDLTLVEGYTQSHPALPGCNPNPQ